MGTKIFIPKMGTNIDTVEVGKIYVKSGDNVKKNDLLFEIITNKAIFQVEAGIDGIILSLNLKEGEELNVLDEVGFIGEKNEEVPELKKKCKIDLKVTPRAKKLAKDKGLDINIIFAGINKVIKEEDIKKYLDKFTIKKNIKEEDIIKEKIDFRKKIEIKYLLESQKYIFSSVTVDVSVQKVRKKIESISEEEGINLSLNKYIMYNTAKLLEKFNKLNSFYHEGIICIYKKINIGFAVNIDEEGLIVPIIHNANKLDLHQFSSKFNDLITKIRKKEITPDNLNGGTFTITNLSKFNVLHFSPVINVDQAGILAISSEYDSCTLKEGNLIYDPKFNLTLAYDHRIIDGKYALIFLNELKEKLQ